MPYEFDGHLVHQAFPLGASLGRGLDLLEELVHLAVVGRQLVDDVSAVPHNHHNLSWLRGFVASWIRGFVASCTSWLRVLPGSRCPRPVDTTLRVPAIPRL